ncbi:MAG: ankyrin repeat domain-containing protein, partial [Symploca sp. SIO2E6]|nr:ankyrin repeat domain-containing protein [Symploca sp. SIO2E6]
MLERGADRGIKEEKGLTALMMAQQYNYPDIEQFLKI